MSNPNKKYLDQYDDGNPGEGMVNSNELSKNQVKELQSLVGEIIFLFNSLESSVDYLIADMVNARSRQPGYTITSEVNVFTKKIAIFKALHGPLLDSVRNKKVTKIFESLVTKLYKIKDIRNEVAHADWLAASKKYEVRLRLSSDQKGPFALTKTMTPQYLKSQIKELIALIWALEEFSLALSEL